MKVTLDYGKCFDTEMALGTHRGASVFYKAWLLYDVLVLKRWKAACFERVS